MLKVILTKEFRQFRRNPFLPRLVVMFPIMIMLLMPLVANMEVRNVNVAVVDHDVSSTSRLIVDKISASDNLKLMGYYHSHDRAMQEIEACRADVVVEIPADFERSLAGNSPKQLSIESNAVNGTKGSLGLQYVMQTINLGSTSVQPSVRFLFNPYLNYRYFMIPALMIMLIIMICGFLPALNIVSEKEKGTIEQINVTPIGRLTFTLGKLIPYWLMGLVVLSLGILIAWLVYGLTPQGSLLTIYAAAALFIILMSSLGLTIANMSDTMQQAMFVMFFFVVVFILMSGLMTPISSMPQWAQYLTYAIPPRFFIDIMRGTYLRGSTMADLWLPFTALLSYAILLAAIATITFKKQN